MSSILRSSIRRPTLLGIDTSSSACAVGLMREGKIEERFHFAPRLHGEILLPQVEELLNHASIPLSEVDAIVYGAGPGSFTGVRLAASIAQGLALGSQKPLMGISSLMAMAYAVYKETGHAHIVSAFDARMGEIYWGIYAFHDGSFTSVMPEQVLNPAEVPELPSESVWVGAGDGWETYGSLLKEKTGITLYYPRSYPKAGSLLQLALEPFAKGNFTAISEALPIYLRNKVV